MPELPEVETMVRGVKDLIVGTKFREIRELVCKCQPLSHSPTWSEINKRLQNTQLNNVGRKGKRIVFEFADQQILVIEPRMTGLLTVDQAPDSTHTRLEFVFLRNRQQIKFWYWDRRGLGVIKLYDPKEADDFLNGTRLGKDALLMNEDDWKQVCQSAKPIKNILMDQQKVAGIGNLYASEILHAAGIHPEKSGKELKKVEIRKLYQEVINILKLAIEYEGSTLSDGTYRNALNKSGRYQNEHRVYMKHDKPCQRCRKSIIVRIVQAQRSTFYCPRCQK